MNNNKIWVDIIKILKKYSIEDILVLEKQDRQFLAIKRLFKKLKNQEYFLPLIITNALISYQLSSKWEDYWEEFSREASKFDFQENKFKLNLLKNFFKEFLPQSKWNKRLLNITKTRINKILNFLEKIINKEQYFYKNILEFQDLLSKNMKQKKDDKTIVFTIKMFYFWARIKFKKIVLLPFEINLPIDSRIIKLTKKFNNSNLSTKDFWLYISKKINIPSLHLDAFLWINCDKIIKK